MKCCGGTGTSGIASKRSVREQEIVTPSRTRRAAWARFSGVIRLRVPSSSSSPQRPQLLSEVYQPRTSASVGMSRAIFPNSHAPAWTARPVRAYADGMTVDGTTRSVAGRRVVVGSVMLAMFLTAIEISIVATAAPAIVSKLGGLAELTWVFSAFLLAQAATIPIYGRLADLYGRRRVFAAGTGVFLVGSLLCGFAGSMTQLIMFRAIQGLGAGAVLPVASTI